MGEMPEKPTKKVTLLGKFLIGLGIFSLVAVGGAAASHTPDATSTASTQKIATSMPQSDVRAASTETRQLTETQNIPFATKTTDDALLAKGQTKVVQEGKEGVKTLTYRVTYSNSQEIARELVSEEITTQPVDKIIHTGTYVAPAYTSCSNGYINTNGNCIPSPSNNPAGATAQCADGTYSYSQSRQGTCSHHGGVAQWL